MGNLTGGLQEQMINLWEGHMKLVTTRAELCSLNPLHQEVASLRDDIVHKISKCFLADEAFWMSLLNFSQGKYPSGVVKQKFRNVALKLKYLGENFKNDVSADRFLADYLKVKASQELMIESGAEKSNIYLLSLGSECRPSVDVLYGNCGCHSSHLSRSRV